jgi:transposase
VLHNLLFVCTPTYQRIQSSSIEQVGREEDLSFTQIQGIFNHQNDQKKTETWGEVQRLSIDEISQRKGHKSFVTVVADIDKGKLIEMIDSHKQEDIVQVLMQQPLEVRERVEEVSVDMWGGFPKVVQKVFPNAKIVIDRFHVMKPVNAELDNIRRQVGITDKGVKFIFLKNGEDLTEEEKVKLTELLARSKRLSIAYALKEDFRSIYESSTSVEEGRERFMEWLLKARSIYGKVVQTIRDHLGGICNYFMNRTTSGTMEGINNRIKLIKRQAYGFLNFDNFRARTLACFSD